MSKNPITQIEMSVEKTGWINVVFNREKPYNTAKDGKVYRFRIYRYYVHSSSDKRRAELFETIVNAQRKLFPGLAIPEPLETETYPANEDDFVNISFRGSVDYSDNPETPQTDADGAFPF